MGQRYSLAVRTPAAAAGAAYADLRAGTPRLRVREIGFTLSAATASSVGLIRAASVGTASTTQAPAASDPADAATSALVGTAWSAAATIAGTPAYLRRFTAPATIGAGMVWTFPYGDGLVVPAAGSLLLWNFGAGAAAALDAWFVYDE